MNRATHVLVVDDDDSLRESVCELLEDEGFKTSNADSGETALESLRSGAERPDLIILDLMMPLMNGWQFREAQVKDPDLATIPVVAMTASRDLRGIQVDEVIYKPIKLARLLDVVRRTQRRDGAHTSLKSSSKAPKRVELFQDLNPSPQVNEPGPSPTEVGRPPPRASGQMGQPRRRRNSATPRGADEPAYALFMQAPLPICVLRGRELVCEMVNLPFCKVTGQSDFLGKPLLEAMPAWKGQGFEDLLGKVMDTGTAISKEVSFKLDRHSDGLLEDAYLTFTFAPLRDVGGAIDRVMAICNEASDQALVRRRVEQSEEKFRWLIAQQVIAGIAQTDLSGRFEFANERYLELVGRSGAELLQLRRQDLIHPDDLPGYLVQFSRLLEHGHPFVIEKRYVKPDGSIVWVQNSVVRVNDSEGRARGVASVTMDITQRKYAERALGESEARFRSIFEMAEVSLWEEDFSAVKEQLDELRVKVPELRAFLEANPSVVDDLIGQVRVVDVNPATLRMFAATNKEQLLTSLGATFVPESRRVFLEELVALAEGRILFSSEATLRTLSGQRVDVLLTMGFSESDVARERALVTLVDVSPQKLMEREREARVTEMERALRFAEVFVGILGHDLRNPLSAITSAASLLSRRADESERIAKPVGRILTSADRMERMISQLLDFTRIRLGKGIPLERKQVDLAEVARVTVDEVESAFSRTVTLKVTGDTFGNWDADRLSQLASNLAANACQHSPEGTAVEIVIDGSEGQTVKLTVSNQGLIPPALLPNIFEPLQSGQKTSGSSGLGLGLYITQQIVLAHGGSIRADSDATRGTSFQVTLPRLPSEMADQVFGAGSEALAGVASRSGATP
jgi:PAS domain S-box-containing protein